MQGFFQRRFRRLLQDAQQAGRIAADQPPQKRRLIGKAEQQAFDFGPIRQGLQAFDAIRRRRAEKIGEAGARDRDFGRLRRGGRDALAFSARGHGEFAFLEMRKDQHRAQAGLGVLDAQGAAMQPRHRRGERQAEAAAGPRPRRLQPHESLHHPRAFIRGNARPMIGDGDFNALVVAARGDFDARRLAGRIGRAIFERIVDEIGQSLADQLALAAKRQRRRGDDAHFDALVLGGRLVKFGHVAHQRGGVEIGQTFAGRLRFGAGDQQQRIENADQAVRLVDGLLQRGAAGGFAMIEQQGLFGVVAQAGQRRAQVMGDIVRNLANPLHQRGDAVEHGVEIARQPVQFVVRAGEGQPPGKIFMQQGRGLVAHRVHPVEQAAGDEQPAEGADHQQPHQGGEQGRAENMRQPLAVFEIMADQQPEMARQQENPRHGAAMDIGFAESFIVGFDRRARLGLVQHAGRQIDDIAGQRDAVRRGDEIDRRSRRARPLLHHGDELVQTALFILFREALELCVDGLAHLIVDQLADIFADLFEHQGKAEADDEEIGDRKLEGGGPEEFCPGAAGRSSDPMAMPLARMEAIAATI